MVSKIRCWKGRLFNNRFFRGVLTLASATAAGQCILVLATPLLTRLYVPAEFGVLAVFTAVMSVALVISSLRYEMAIPLLKSMRNARQLLVVALGINLVTALVSLFLVALFRQEMASLTKTPELANYLWLLPVAIVTAGSYKVFTYWAVRNKDFKCIAITKISQSFASVGIQLVAGITGLGALGLIIGQLVGQTVGVAKLSKGTGLFTLGAWKSFIDIRSRALLIKHQRFPKYDVPASAVDVMSVQLPNILLASLFSPGIAGFYMLAERTLAMPMSLLGKSVGQVLYGVSHEAINKGTLGRLVQNVVLGLCAIIILPTLIMFFVGDDLFAFLFGEIWRDAGLYASWLVMGLSIQFIYSPISLVLMATNGQHVNLYIHIFMLLAKASAVLYGYYSGSPLTAIIGFSVAGAVGYGWAILIILARSKKYDALSIEGTKG